MGTLFEETPEARDFCTEVVANIDRYRIDQREAFSETHVAVLSTSLVDLQGDAFTRSALDEMAAQIRRELVWIGYNHDPLVPPIGRIIAAGVFYAPTSELYFVAAVVGRYAKEAYCSFDSLSLDTEPAKEFPVENRPAGPLVTLACNPHEVSEDDIRSALDGAPDFVAAKPVNVFRKAADPLTVVSVFLSAWFLTSNPFSKKFLERHGEAAAELSLSLMRWLREAVCGLVTRLKPRRVLLELRCPFEGCSIDFVIDSKDPTVLSAALDQLAQARDPALSLAHSLRADLPRRIVYAWEANAGKWVPRYATTTRGVITDQPYLMAIEWKGFSAAGVATRYGQPGESID